MGSSTYLCQAQALLGEVLVEIELVKGRGRGLPHRGGERRGGELGQRALELRRNHVYTQVGGREGARGERK